MIFEHDLDGWLAIHERAAARWKYSRKKWEQLSKVFKHFTQHDKQLIDEDHVLSNERLGQLAESAGVKVGTVKWLLLDFHRWRAEWRSSLPPNIREVNDPVLGRRTTLTPRSDPAKAKPDLLCIRKLSGDESVDP